MSNVIKFTSTDKDNLTGTTDTNIVLGANQNIVSDGDIVYAITDDLRVCKYIDGVLSNCCLIVPIITTQFLREGEWLTALPPVNGQFLREEILDVI